jgi:hypothetical protein
VILLRLGLVSMRVMFGQLRGQFACALGFLMFFIFFSEQFSRLPDHPDFMRSVVMVVFFFTIFSIGRSSAL